VRNRTLVALLVVSLGLNIGFLLHRFWLGTAAARTTGPACSWRNGPMTRRLGLAPQQAQRLEDERQRVLAQARPLQGALQQKRRELLVLLRRGGIPEAELDPVIGEIARLQAAIEKVFVLHAEKVRGLLTPDQLGKYDGSLERGLCSGAMAGASCAPARGSGQWPGSAACAGQAKRGNKKR
jgi:Spy/CpxP family protein refolding chaperone